MALFLTLLGIISLRSSRGSPHCSKNHVDTYLTNGFLTFLVNNFINQLPPPQPLTLPGNS